MYPNISGTMHLHVYKTQQRSIGAIPDSKHEVCVTATRLCAIDLGSATCVGSVAIISNHTPLAIGFRKLQAKYTNFAHHRIHWQCCNRCCGDGRCRNHCCIRQRRRNTKNLQRQHRTRLQAQRIIQYRTLPKPEAKRGAVCIHT